MTVKSIKVTYGNMVFGFELNNRLNIMQIRHLVDDMMSENKRKFVIVIHLLLVLCVPIYVLQFKDCLIDDTFITARYAYNLKNFGVWGLNSGWCSNTATSPLNVLILTGFLFLSKNIIAAVMAMTVAMYYMIAIALYTISKQIGGTIFYLVSFVGLLFNPLLSSTFGMESMLYISLFLLAISLVLHKKFYALSICVAFLTLTRPDGILVFVLSLLCLPIFKAGSVNHIKLRMLLGYIGLYLLVIMPWFMFAWIKLGSFFPETLFIKMFQTRYESNCAWGGLTFLTGFKAYFIKYPWAFASSFSLLPFSAFLVISQKHKLNRQIISFLIVFSVIYWLAYCFLGVPPYHWYYIPLLPCCVLSGAMGISALFLNCRGRPTVTLSSTLIIIMLLLFNLQCSLPRDRQVCIHSNWASLHDYRQIAKWLKKNIPENDPVKFQGEIGTLAYFSERTLIDAFSSDDTTQTVIRVLKKRGKMIRAVGNVNFYWHKDQNIPTDFHYELIGYPDNKNILCCENIIKQWQLTSSWNPKSALVLYKINKNQVIPKRN